MAQISQRVLKALAQSSANEKDIVSAINAAGKKPTPPMETPSDTRRKRTYSRRDMTAGEN